MLALVALDEQRRDLEDGCVLSRAELLEGGGEEPVEHQGECLRTGHAACGARIGARR
jgi:hypothetical protein